MRKSLVQDVGRGLSYRCLQGWWGSLLISLDLFLSAQDQIKLNAYTWKQSFQGGGNIPDGLLINKPIWYI